MKKYLPIVKDAAILLLVSTMFVTLCNMFFKSLKKTVDADPVVTAMLQNNIAAARDLLGNKPAPEADQPARRSINCAICTASTSRSSMSMSTAWSMWTRSGAPSDRTRRSSA
jgi:hypothetical protein